MPNLLKFQQADKNSFSSINKRKRPNDQTKDKTKSNRSTAINGDVEIRNPKSEI